MDTRSIELVFGNTQAPVMVCLLLGFDTRSNHAMWKPSQKWLSAKYWKRVAEQAERRRRRIKTLEKAPGDLIDGN
jgi:hypothetical protein